MKKGVIKMPASLKLNKSGIKKLQKKLEIQMKKSIVSGGSIRLRKDSEKFLEIVLRKRDERKTNTITCSLSEFDEIPNIVFNCRNIMDDLIIHNCISSNSSACITGEVEIILTMDGIDYFKHREEHMEEERRFTNNTNNFFGEVTGVQIQQGTVHSSQSQSVTQGFDYDGVADIIEKIKKYDSLFDDEYGERASEMRNRINQIEHLIQKKENPGKIKMLLDDIKNLSIGITGSVIASGIVALIAMI